MLFYVNGDYEYLMVKRRGRFALERECAKSPAHLEAAVRQAQEKFIWGAAKRGYLYAGGGFELRGPLDHIDYSDDVTTDPGPTAMPDPRDLRAMEAWERAEKARQAKSLSMPDLVDFVLVGKFKKKVGRARVSWLENRELPDLDQVQKTPELVIARR